MAGQIHGRKTWTVKDYAVMAEKQRPSKYVTREKPYALAYMERMKKDEEGTDSREKEAKRCETDG